MLLEMERILFRVQGTVIIKIWWKVSLITVYTAVVLCIAKFALEWNPRFSFTTKCSEIQKHLFHFHKNAKQAQQDFKFKELLEKDCTDANVLLEKYIEVLNSSNPCEFLYEAQLTANSSKVATFFLIFRGNLNCPGAQPIQWESILAIFGMVTGFLLVFRTNTAYDRLLQYLNCMHLHLCKFQKNLISWLFYRYWESRELWSSVTLNIRNLTRLIWTMVSFDKLRVYGRNAQVIERISVINLLPAFAYATRNYLRNNHSYEEKDLKPFLKHCPKLFKDHYLTGALTPPRNIPIEISHMIMRYVTMVREQKLIDDPTATIINTVLNNLVECIGQFEKILMTPIPMAYTIHLNHAIWLYFIILPYQLYELLDWWTIPVVAITAFTMLGILDIGEEIDNPFGANHNDLVNICCLLNVGFKNLQSCYKLLVTVSG